MSCQPEPRRSTAPPRAVRRSATGERLKQKGLTHVTRVRDATAVFSHDMMRVAHELSGSPFAPAILTTAEPIAALPKAPDPKGRRP